MGVRCEGVEGAIAKPPPRLRRGEILCNNKNSRTICVLCEEGKGSANALSKSGDPVIMEANTGRG